MKSSCQVNQHHFHVLLRFILVCAGLPVAIAQSPSTLENRFRNPPVTAKPYVWWHWMGSNFSKVGITKDLEAMKEAGIGGATIFNLSSAVQETHVPTQNNPWPHQTYRSPAYWEALKHAAAEASRLGLEIGLHNTVGYSTTGGPWVTQERAMQKLVWSKTNVEGGQQLSVVLAEPPKPIFTGWGSTRTPATYYRDMVVLALPEKANAGIRDVVDLTGNMTANGQLTWSAPAGKWTVYRIGHSPTMANPHPVPDELIGHSLEVDKMNADQTNFHWDQVLEPLKNHLGPYLGKSFRHMLIDSYEADHQDWTVGLQDEFRRRKGYDPLPWLLCFTPSLTGTADKGERQILENKEQTTRFLWDYRDVISQLFYEKGWAIAKKKLNETGLTLQFEPYSGPFDMLEGAALADLPMGEFWTHRTWEATNPIPAVAHATGKQLVGAEAFTGRPETSQWTEDPAFLKQSADGAFVGGINRLILHHWVHQPFDDRYQPGMGMGWWGTHFSRHQTWAEPGKAFFAYLGRCQALLQSGQQVADYLCVGKLEGFADVLSIPDFLRDSIRVEKGNIVLASGRTYPFIAFPKTGQMLPEVARKIKRLVMAGATVVSARPTTSPSLVNYPACDDTLRVLGEQLWGANKPAHTDQKGAILPTVAEAIRRFGIQPDFVVESANDASKVHAAHRREQGSDLYFVANQADVPQRVTLSFRIAGKQPELWQAEDGSIRNAPVWQQKNGRTSVQLYLKGLQSVFVVFRKPVSNVDHPIRVAVADTAVHWIVNATATGIPMLQSQESLQANVTYSSGKTRRITLGGQPAQELKGEWRVAFTPKLGTPFQRSFTRLVDFSQHPDTAVRYFAGTAAYQKTMLVKSTDLSRNQRLFLALGELNDLAEVSVNGKKLGVLWYPPYELDITDALTVGQNQLEIKVTNNWANRLIGDEQYPADFDWGPDRDDKGRAIKAYPDWFIQQKPRPSAGRKTFSVWYYHRKDSPLQPAGLVGPVRLVAVQQTGL
ncbi:glycosyl hydrolase [Fibrella aquatica]|uniref:glycosyl hydrolase n=1 Tax=Fibrella aquatica TaxID=3242487 RepID=UPI003520A8E6